MERTESVELTVLCLVHDGDRYLLQDRVKQFPTDEGRYSVFFFRADQFEGELASSEKGEMRWVGKEDLSRIQLVNDFHMLQVMLDDGLNELQYVMENDKWKAILK